MDVALEANAKNLETLGAARLPELLIEISTGPAVSILSENRHYPEFDQKNILLDQLRRSYLLVAWKL